MTVINKSLNVCVKLEKDATLPYQATCGSAGADLSCNKAVVIKPKERCLIETGVSMEIPCGHLAFVIGRSGNTINKGLHVALGLIDSDYRGNIGVMAFNQSDKEIAVKNGDRIGQIVILPVPQINFIEVDELSKTERGEGGYGSTGN